MALKTKPFNIQNYLKTAEQQEAYLEAVIEEGDASYLAAAIGNIARARGATEFARESGISRETIYKMFRDGGNPRLETIMKALNTLGLSLALVHKKVKAS